MVETQRVQTKEQESARKRIFQLTPTKVRVGIGEESEKKHPCFPVLLTSYNPRWINNLRMSELNYDQGTVTIMIEEFEVEGFRQLCLDEVKFDGDILFIGNDGKIACDQVRHNGEIKFFMSMAEDITVYSEKGTSIRLRNLRQ